MKYTLENQKGFSLIRIEGSMSDDFLREIRGAFESALARDEHIIVDIADVSFISSSGLGLLFNTNSRLKSKGKNLFVSGAHEEVRRLFAVTRIDSHIILTDNYEEALNKI